MEKLGFIVGGCQKCGTTTLYAHLRRHPALVAADAKELHFFDDDARDWSDPDYGAYHARFPQQPGVRFEITPTYLWWPQSLERIRRYSPEMKLIFMFRDPVERAFSHWCFSYARSTGSRNMKMSFISGLQRRMRSSECGQPEEVSRILRQGGVCMLGENAHIHKGIGFAGVKGFGGGFGRRMLGAFGEPAVKAFVQETIDECRKLEIALRSLHTEKKIVVLHYSPVEDTVIGEPEGIFAYLGCSRLAETIDRYDVTAVFHGHAHRGSYKGKTPKGIPVFNTAAGIEKEGGKAYAVLVV